MDLFSFCNFSLLVVLYLVGGVTEGMNSSTRKEIVALLGQNTSLECQLESLVMTLSWKKEDQVIFQHVKIRSNTSTSKQTAKKTSEVNKIRRKAILTLSYVHYNDSGEYQCSQFQKSGREKVSVFHLVVYGHPLISVEPSIVKENEKMNSTCCINSSTSSNEIKISLLLVGKPLPQPYRTTVMDMTNGLVRYCINGLEITAKRGIHKENLTCCFGSSNISASHIVNVLYPPTLKLATTSSLTVNNNEKDVYITCKADGNPQPQVNLQKKARNGKWNGLKIRSKKSVEDNKIRWTFYIGNESNDITGMYRCIAFNDVDVAALSKTVEVKYNYSDSKKNISTILLVVVLLVIGLFAVINVFKTKRRERYEHYVEVTRNFYSRHINGLSNNFRRLTSTRNPVGNTLPDICDHSSLDREGGSPVGQKRQTNTHVKTSYTLSKPKRTFGKLSLSRKGNAGSTDIESDQIYANFSLSGGIVKSDREVEELDIIPQYATLSKSGNTN